jgi:hypothetical protein
MEDITSEELRSRVGYTERQSIEKYGIIEGTKRWKAYCEKHREKNTFESKKKKFNWSEEQFKQYNLSRATTLENLIKRHGQTDGVRKWDTYCKRQAYAGCAKEYFIEKYGPIIGVNKYNEINKQKGITLDKFIRKYGEINGTHRWHELLKSKSNLTHYSKSSQKLFNEIQKQMPDHDLSYYDKYGSEYFFYLKYKKRYIFVDLYDKTINKCIEYFGDYWHCNPLIYNENYVIAQNGNTAKEIWKIDEERVILLKDEYNIDTLIIWEAEYLSQPENTINKCKDFLNENRTI